MSDRIQWSSSDYISRQQAENALAEAMPKLTTPDGRAEGDYEISIAQQAYVDAIGVIHNLPPTAGDDNADRIRQGLYRHFKGLYYRVLGFAIHSETGELHVVYQAMYGVYACYIRPYKMFASEVDHEKYPKITQKYRFERVGD